MENYGEQLLNCTILFYMTLFFIYTVYIFLLDYYATEVRCIIEMEMKYRIQKGLHRVTLAIMFAFFFHPNMN